MTGRPTLFTPFGCPAGDSSHTGTAAHRARVANTDGDVVPEDPEDGGAVEVVRTLADDEHISPIG